MLTCELETENHFQCFTGKANKITLGGGDLKSAAFLMRIEGSWEM